MRRVLVTGALGQIGSEIVPVLREKYGCENVVASDIRLMPGAGGEEPFELIDCTQHDQLQEVVRRLDIGTIYHLAALLSAVAEQKPHVAWDLNMSGLYGVLEVARRYRCKVFFPSSIGAFGPSTPRDQTPQVTIQRPTTMYGLTKVAGELLCDYYFQRFGVDTRSLRLPGIISFVAPPGGGTTDYAVDIFYQAIRYHHYTCFLRADTQLDMMYMPDMVRAVLELMEADGSKLINRNSYNVTAMNFTPDELAAEIRKHDPSFVIDYDPDPVRQGIADTWPRSIDDSAAQDEWNWQPRYDLASMTEDMLAKLRQKLRTVR